MEQLRAEQRAYRLAEMRRRQDNTATDKRPIIDLPFKLAGRGQSAAMLALIAAILFVIGFIINAANISTSAVFSPFSFLLAGLACLAYHMTGTGPAWSGLRRRR